MFTVDYVALGATCTDTGAAPVNAPIATSSNVANIPAGNMTAGAVWTCVFNNGRQPTVSVQVVTNTTTGGPFTFTSSNLATTPAGNTTTATATAQPAAPVKHNVSTVGTQVSLTENIPTTHVLTTVVCNDNNTAGSGNTNPVYSGTVANFNIPSARIAYGADINCVFSHNAANPSLSFVKLANTAGPVSVNDVISYTFRVVNNGNVPITSVQVLESLENRYGAAVVPTGENLFSDIAPTGDSTDPSGVNGTWDTIGPGDEVRFTGTYTVVQSDIDFNQ